SRPQNATVLTRSAISCFYYRNCPNWALTLRKNSFCLYCPGRQTCQAIVKSSNENFRAPERELFLYAICTFQRIETDFYVKTICGHFLIYDDIGFLALDVAKEARIIEFEKCPVRSFAALWHHQQLHGLFAADSSDRNRPRKPDGIQAVHKQIYAV